MNQMSCKFFKGLGISDLSVVLPTALDIRQPMESPANGRYMCVSFCCPLRAVGWCAQSRAKDVLLLV